MANGKAAVQPLRERAVLLVCSPLKSERLKQGLESLGAKVTPFQAITIRPLQKTPALDSALTSVEQCHWIIFTSGYAVHFFFRRASELSVPMERLRSPEICAVGPATARLVEKHGLAVSMVAGEYVAEGILSAFVQRLGNLGNLSGRRILLPRAKEAREILPEELRAAGAEVLVAPCYETVKARTDPAAVRAIMNQTPDLLIFTSASNVSNFAAIVGETDLRRLLDQATIAALGPITARALESLGKTPEIIPAENSIPCLLEAVRRYYGARCGGDEPGS